MVAEQSAGHSVCDRDYLPERCWGIDASNRGPSDAISWRTWPSSTPPSRTTPEWGLFVGTGLQVNFNVTDSSFDNNGPTGCIPGLGCSWQIQNGTSTLPERRGRGEGRLHHRTKSLDTELRHLPRLWKLRHWRPKCCCFRLLSRQRESAANFTVNGGQWFDSSTTTGCITNPSGQLSS